MAKEKKINLTFWQLFTVVVVALVLGGVIYNFAWNSMIQDEINSISFDRFDPQSTQTPAKKPIKK